jgi:hypothetical protein
MIDHSLVDCQIAPFQVDFAVKEMSLDFSSVKTAGKIFLLCEKELEQP